jgi:hypothetical protein
MYELIPILGGVLTGVVAFRLDVGARRWLIAAAAIALGSLAAIASGEVKESWLFLLWDMAQVVVAAVLTLAAAARIAARARH